MVAVFSVRVGFGFWGGERCGVRTERRGGLGGLGNGDIKVDTGAVGGSHGRGELRVLMAALSTPGELWPREVKIMREIVR